MFRHEKTFFHQTGIAIELRSSEAIERNRAKIHQVENLTVERVGEQLTADLFFVTFDS